MNIQEAATASGLAPDTIRFYERHGVLPAPPRQANGYRNYTGKHIQTLKLAKGFRHLGVPLEDVKPILATAHDGTCGQLRERMQGTLDEALKAIDRQIEELLHTRQHVASILSGLETMTPSDTTVPGTTPCECFQLLTSLED